MKSKIYRSRKHTPGEPPVSLPPEVEYFALCSLKKMLNHYGNRHKIRLVEERMEEILSRINLNYDDLLNGCP